ncbi:unnamed protein product [Lactuca saligna]|uniref:Uncharacterized protein n=1 Tax=Lactuca saligna TaxID=75948 RepID=A0AA35ZR72_LACSI|nr:unnamed protein product [Lactuca saligna]
MVVRFHGYPGQLNFKKHKMRCSLTKLEVVILTPQEKMRMILCCSTQPIGQLVQYREEVVYLHCDGEDNVDDETESDSELISVENNSGFITASQSQSCSIDP